jgi:hypothetical protein
MIVSVGILYAALDLLELVSKTSGIDQKFPEMFRTFSVASPKITLDFAQRCGWVKFNVDGYLELTPRGSDLLELKQTEVALRYQIADVIDSYSPSWGPLLSRGRIESLQYLPIDIQQCLREAGLLGQIDDSIIGWWDTVAEATRKSVSEAKLRIGRIGERLSLNYERQRTGTEPIWQSIESNLCGYDILSVREPGSTSRLCIEVKTSNSTPGASTCHLTRLEWEVARTSENFAFHLWALQPKPTLYIADAESVSASIPDDKGDGHWESVFVSFAGILKRLMPMQAGS